MSESQSTDGTPAAFADVARLLASAPHRPLFLAGTVAVLLGGTALVQAADVSFLTHWPPETVSKLEAAAATYSQSHPETTITVRAVPFDAIELELGGLWCSPK